MRAVRAFAILVFVGAGAVFACSSSSTGNAGGFDQQFCSLIAPCCSKAGLPNDQSHCTTLLSLLASSSQYSPSDGQACIDGLHAESSKGTLCTALGNDVAACNHVFSGGGGTAGPGQSCTRDGDCAAASGGGATCFQQTTFLDGGGTTQTASCVQTQPGKLGDSPCIGTNSGSVTFYSWSTGMPPGMAYVCDQTQGSTCDTTAMACIALGTTGRPCSGDMSCVMSDYCSFGQVGGKCIARIANGGSCASAASGCEMGSYCDATSQTCTMSLANGATCMTSEQCQSNSCENGMCSGSNNLGLSLFCG